MLSVSGKMLLMPFLFGNSKIAILQIPKKSTNWNLEFGIWNFLVICSLAICILPNSTAAYSVPARPGSVGQVQGLAGAESGGSSTLRTKMDEALCGGWDWDQEVAGKIPIVTGLPGHDQAGPLGNKKSGMSLRSDYLKTPSDVPTCGYRSACRPIDGGGGTARFRPPFYKAFPCQRPLGDATPENPADPPGRGSIKFSCGGSEMPEDGNVCGSIGAGVDGGLCGWLNDRWVFGYYNKVIPMDYKCRDANRSKQPHLPGCTLTMYSRRTSCRVQKAGEVEQKDKDKDVVPKYPGMPGEELDFVEPRLCCTYQSVDGIVYGPDGAGDGTGDITNYMKNCITCSNTECRYILACVDTNGNGIPDDWGPGCQPEPDRPRMQYYPPWIKEVYSDACSYCTSIDDPKGKKVVPCDADDADFPKFPCVEKFKPYEVTDPDLGITFINYYRRRQGPRYRSYFRHYTGNYERDQVKYIDNNQKDTYEDPIRDDNKKSNIPVSCYRIYSEYDPKLRVTDDKRKVCVIAAYYREQERNFWAMGKETSEVEGSPTQEGKGYYSLTMDDIDKIVRENDFEEDKDVWYPGTSNAFSLSDQRTIKKKYENDLTLLLSSPTDITHLESSIQAYYTKEDMPDAKKKEDRMIQLSSGALLRAFDDTVSNETGPRRFFTEWWQEQQTKAHLVFTPPAIRLLLPPAWSIGLDPLDPIFTPRIIDTTKQAERDPRMQVLEVQLHAGEDTIDIIKTYLQKSLLPNMQEEHIPVLVPMGSPLEFRALAEKWAKYYSFKGKTAVADQDIVLVLESYARQIEQVRKLRADVVWFSKKLIEHQKNIVTTIGDWLSTDITGRYDEYYNQLADLQNLQTYWKQIQKDYREFHNKSCMPWCHNERFTVPIYSLLDEWYKGRPDLTGSELPRFDVERLSDATFDFTGLKYPSADLKIPIIRPIQVRIDIAKLAAPDPGAKNVNVPVLPEFPPVPSIMEYMNQMMDTDGDGDVDENDESTMIPDLVIGKRPPSITMDMYSPAQLTDIQRNMLYISEMFEEMNEIYKKFWKSQTKFDYDTPEDDLKFKEQDCYRRGTETCVHVEWDLLERLMRFGSRPAIMLEEEFDKDEKLAIGRFRPKPVDPFYVICPADDWACQLMHRNKTYPQEGWAINWEGASDKIKETVCKDSEGGTLIDQLRTCMFRETLQRPGVKLNPSGYNKKGLFPYSSDRNDIVPSFNTPAMSGGLIPKK